MAAKAWAGERGESMLIIGTKCYGQSFGTAQGKEILSPDLLNQIFKYVVSALSTRAGWT